MKLLTEKPNPGKAMCNLYGYVYCVYHTLLVSVTSYHMVLLLLAWMQLVIYKALQLQQVDVQLYVQAVQTKDIS